MLAFIFFAITAMPDMLEVRFHFSTLLKFLIGFVFFDINEVSDLLDARFRTFLKLLKLRMSLMLVFVCSL